MPKNRFVYLDNAATTPVDKQVIKKMLPFFGVNFGNPSALYELGVRSFKAITDSRRTISKFLNSQPDTIYFTSGGTESDNLAISGVAAANTEKGKHIITSSIEHHAIINPLEKLRKKGWEITYLKPDKFGKIDCDELIKAIRPDTVLVSLMYANNEIGTIEPIAEIGRGILKHRKQNNTVFPYFHTDACQAAGYLGLDVEKLHVDLMSLNGGKIYGPKGVGVLYVRRGVKIEAQLLGGEQENKLRAGTENVPGIVGFAKAFEMVQNNKDKEVKRLQKLSEYFLKKTKKIFPEAVLNGPPIGDDRLPNNINLTFRNFEGEQLVIYLSNFGVMCSTASACTVSSSEPSHVLEAIGLEGDALRSSVRFSLGKTTSKKDIDYALSALGKTLKLLQK